MNTCTYNEKVTLGARTAPAAVASRTYNSGHVARDESLAEILLRPFKRAKIDRELRSLDARMLSDIGISRSDIGRIAVESAGGRTEWLAVSLARYAARRLAGWARRREAYRSLNALDDRMLADIGLRRDEIPVVVRTMAADRGLEGDLTLPLRQWNLWRATHRQLNRLDDRTLNDIGFVRGDVGRVADELASRAAARTANSNETAPRAA